ncbi:MAG: hypothetical protein HC838_12200 [Spirulinaceae cyanobacterium RM2_2_10]|nr:hypothetical protein [Spirulinaceae cyanobacterium SM2_1_0]NJO20637.1 hypothetical protein [Spirulinaceae cyanobacterium RM2_2_10]
MSSYVYTVAQVRRGTSNSPVYGRSGIQEYWILDVQERCLYVFRQPQPTGYGEQQVLAKPDRIASLAFPEGAIAIRDFLRSDKRR